MSFQLALCDERAVCANTIKIALAERGLKAVLRHTKNAGAKVIQNREMLASIQGEVTTLADRMKLLASRKMNRDAMGSILDRLFPKTRNDDGETKETTRRSNILADVLKIYELNDGNAFPEQRGTAYNLLNAITNYVDHERSSKDDGRAESALFGSGNSLKSKALEVILESSKGLDTVPQRITVHHDGGSTGSSVLDAVMAETVGVS